MRPEECVIGLQVRLSERGMPRQRTIDRALAGEDSARVAMRLIMCSRPATVSGRDQSGVTVRTRDGVQMTTAAKLLCTDAELGPLLALLRRRASADDQALPALALLLRYYRRLERHDIGVSAYMGVLKPHLSLTLPRRRGQYRYLYNVNAQQIERELEQAAELPAQRSR